MTNPISEVLLPCPFCGGEACLCIGYHANTDAKVICKNCSAEGQLFGENDWSGDSFKEEAIAAWNRRAACQTPVVPTGYTLIPTDALKWLHGEGDDFECKPQHYLRGKAPTYWWRSEFRRRCAAAPDVTEQEKG